jgi:signal peptidase II
MSGPRAIKWRLLAAVFSLSLLADQATKFLAVDRLTIAFERAGAHGLVEKLRAFARLRFLESLATPPYYVFQPCWRMYYVENPAAAFSFGAFVPPQLRHPMFIVISIAAIGFILYYYRRAEERQRFLQVALAFVLAGTIGNLIDRLLRRYVIDFIDWYWWNRPDLRWPTFNIADSLLVVGIAMLLLHPAPGKAPAPDAAAGVSGNKRGASRV